MIQYHTLPEPYLADMHGYIERGERVSSELLHHILTGDLWQAYVLSGPIPEVPGDQLLTLAGWIYGQAPQECFGSVHVVRAWMLAGGLQGRKRATLSERLEFERRKLDYLVKTGRIMEGA